MPETETPPAAKKAAASRTRKKAEPTIEEALAVLDKAKDGEDFAEAAEVAAWIEQAAPATDGKPTNTLTALLAVMREVRAVGKNGQNEDQGYKFRGVDDVVNAIGPAMRRHGLLMLPNLVRKDEQKFERQNQYGKVSYSTAVQTEVEYRFVWAFGPADDMVIVRVPGESFDTSDKATAKAMSVALRIALLQTFALPTYDTDPDQHNPEPERILPISAEEFRGAVKHASTYEDLDQGFRELVEHYGARIDVSKGVTAAGEELDGHAYLAHAKQVAAEWRAQKEAERAAQEQDKAAQGPTSEQEPAARAQDAPSGDDADAEFVRAQDEERLRAQGEVRERAANIIKDHERAKAETERRPDDNERQHAQRAAGERVAREASAPQETRHQRLARQAQDELEFQADALGVPLPQHAEPVLTTPGDLSTLKVATCSRYIIGQRAAVIEKLRELGMATVADRYAAKGQGFPLILDDVTEGDAKESAPAQ